MTVHRAQQSVSELPLDELRALAEQGDARAQVAVRWKYFDGEGVPQDDAEAVRWLRHTADQGQAATPHVAAVPHRKGHSGRTFQTTVLT